MIRARGSRGVISKSLGTVCARLRFPSHSRMGRSRKLAWAPVTLRWRRKAIGLSNARNPAARRQEIWTLQFHLHLASRSAELLREVKVVKSFRSSIARHSERLVLKHHMGGIREVNSQLQVIREVLSRTTADGKGLPNLKSVPPDRASSTSFSPQATARLISRKQMPSLDQIRKIFVLGTTKIVDTLRFESHSKLCQREFQIMRFRNLGLQDAVSRRKHQGPASSELGLNPELVWRTAQHVQNDGIKQREESFTSGEQRVRLLPQQEVQLQTMSPSKPATEDQFTKMDSRVLDRLTDDVISRVERRIRIERERRGL
jgi:hypothetical protein